MSRSIPVMLAMAALLPLGASAQAHQHGAQAGGGTMPSDSSQAGMMQMHEQMQQHMAQMQEHMQAMQGMMEMHGQQGGQGMEGMSGMGQQQAMQSGTCVVSGSQAGLSALLLGGASNLGLTEAQTSSLQAILEKARSDALEALTPEQRQKLEAAPSAPAACPRAQPSAGSGG